jgi:hypothetical protein
MYGQQARDEGTGTTGKSCEKQRQTMIVGEMIWRRQNTVSLERQNIPGGIGKTGLACSIGGGQKNTRKRCGMG